MHNTLESSKLFPYLAWLTIILFSVFTYSLARNLHTELSDLGTRVDQLEAQASAK
jgi:hypothetical protein